MDSVTTHEASTMVGSRMRAAMPIFIVRGEITRRSWDGGGVTLCDAEYHQAKALDTSVFGKLTIFRCLLISF